MFPERLLDVDIHAGRIHPAYLTARDLVWVEEALRRVRACQGRPRREVEVALGFPPLWGERRDAWRALKQMLLRERGFKVEAGCVPREARAALFTAAGAAPIQIERRHIVAGVAESLGLSLNELERSLYADVPSSRILRPPPTKATPVGPSERLEQYNLRLAQGLLARAETVTARLHEGVRPVVRFARLQGLLCLVRRRQDGAGAGIELEVSGPLSVLRHTLKYGRALARWLPALVRAPGWELTATCLLRGERLRWLASCTDPIGTTHDLPKRHDSKLEERFEQDFRRATHRWQVLREADPVQIGRHILCPDFTLVDSHSGLRVPLEIIGYWTPEYLRAKSAVIDQLPPGSRWLLAVDERLDLGSHDTGHDAVSDRAPATASVASGPGRTRVLHFRRRIDVRPLLDLLGRMASSRHA